MEPKFRIIVERWNPDTRKWEKKRRITLDAAFTKLLDSTNYPAPM